MKLKELLLEEVRGEPIELLKITDEVDQEVAMAAFEGNFLVFDDVPVGQFVENAISKFIDSMPISDEHRRIRMFDDGGAAEAYYDYKQKRLVIYVYAEGEWPGPGSSRARERREDYFEVKHDNTEVNRLLDDPPVKDYLDISKFMG
jgi:hypothetical protein